MYNIAACLLRRVARALVTSPGGTTWQCCTLLAGCVAGGAITIDKSGGDHLTSFTLYAGVRAGEFSANGLVAGGWLPVCPQVDVVLFCVACSRVLSDTHLRKPHLALLSGYVCVVLLP